MVRNITVGLFILGLFLSISACSSGKKVTPVMERTKIIAPALSPAERLIQFVDTGDPVFLKGVFTDSILNRMSINEMVRTRNDFVRSFGVLLNAEGPQFDSDTTASIIFHHEDITLIANLLLNGRGLIRDLTINQDLGNELGAF